MNNLWFWTRNIRFERKGEERKSELDPLMNILSFKKFGEEINFYFRLDHSDLDFSSKIHVIFQKSLIDLEDF